MIPWRFVQPPSQRSEWIVDLLRDLFLRFKTAHGSGASFPNIKQERDVVIERETFFESKGHGSLRRRIRSIRHVPGLLELEESSAQARLMMLVSQIAGTSRRNASFREKQAKPGNKQKRTEDQHQR